MKTFISIISLACLCLISMQAQTVDKEALYIYQTDGKANIFFRNEVTAISLEMKDGVMHQVVYTGNKQHYFAISKIQSMSFVNPDEDTYRPQKIGDENSPTFGKVIDLGLPSGTKWASFNVGASCPEEYGGYYAWGEVSEKSVYIHDTYQYDWDWGETYQYGSSFPGDDIAGTQFDVAYVQWGGSWMMPSFDQIEELLEYCGCEWTAENGVYGKLFIGPSGDSIFLPAAGYHGYGGLYHAGSDGYYWSSTRYDVHDSYIIDFDSGGEIRNVDDCFRGLSVRPVVRN